MHTSETGTPAQYLPPRRGARLPHKQSIPLLDNDWSKEECIPDTPRARNNFLISLTLSCWERGNPNWRTMESSYVNTPIYQKSKRRNRPFHNPVQCGSDRASHGHSGPCIRTTGMYPDCARRQTQVERSASPQPDVNREQNSGGDGNRMDMVTEAAITNSSRGKGTEGSSKDAGAAVVVWLFF